MILISTLFQSSRQFNSKLAFLEQKLREDIERELHDVIAMENQLHSNIKSIQVFKTKYSLTCTHNYVHLFSPALIKTWGLY